MNTPRRRSRFLMDLVRLVEEKILSVVERIFAVLDGKTNYHSFELRLKKELDGLGCDLLEYVIEALKQKVEEDAKQDPNWKRVRKDDRKELLTLFGPIVYHRSYYLYLASRKSSIRQIIFLAPSFP